MKLKRGHDFDLLTSLKPGSIELKLKLIETLEHSDQLVVVINKLNKETGLFKIELHGVFRGREKKKYEEKTKGVE